MKDILKILLFFLIGSFIVSCSGSDDDGNGNGGETETPWDKSRTAKCLLVSNLSEGNLISGTNYTAVANFVKTTNHHVAILDKANVSYSGTTITNPGINVAALSGYMPVFVPIDKTSNGYTGNIVLFDHTIPSLEQRVVTENCWLMRKDINFTSALRMNFSTVSFNAEEQLDAGVSVIKNSLNTSALVIGTIKRNLASAFQTKVSSSFANGGYIMEIVENADANSAYCIYIIGSSKWKFRELTESNVSGNIKGFLLQVEHLK